MSKINLGLEERILAMPGFMRHRDGTRTSQVIQKNFGKFKSYACEGVISSNPQRLVLYERFYNNIEDIFPFFRRKTVQSPKENYVEKAINGLYSITHFDENGIRLRKTVKQCCADGKLKCKNVFYDFKGLPGKESPVWFEQQG